MQRVPRTGPVHLLLVACRPAPPPKPHVACTGPDPARSTWGGSGAHAQGTCWKRHLYQTGLHAGSSTRGWAVGPIQTSYGSSMSGHSRVATTRSTHTPGPALRALCSTRPRLTLFAVCSLRQTGSRHSSGVRAGTCRMERAGPV